MFRKNLNIMKQKKFKIKSSTLFKFKAPNSFATQWQETEPTTSMTSTTSITTTGIFNK